MASPVLTWALVLVLALALSASATRAIITPDDPTGSTLPPPPVTPKSTTKTTSTQSAPHATTTTTTTKTRTATATAKITTMTAAEGAIETTTTQAGENLLAGRGAPTPASVAPTPATTEATAIAIVGATSKELSGTNDHEVSTAQIYRESEPAGAGDRGGVRAYVDEDLELDREMASVIQDMGDQEEPPGGPLEDGHGGGGGTSGGHGGGNGGGTGGTGAGTGAGGGTVVIGSSGGRGGKRQNYASLDAGATILDSSADLKSTTSLLVPDKDRYMLMACEKPRKWVVVSLSEDVHADVLVTANYEKYSSMIKDFLVLGSVNYPTDTWLVLGNFTAEPRSGEQYFALDSQHHVRYIKLRFLSHYGSEYYCTLSQLKVFGRTFTQVISQLEKSIDAEVGALDASTLLPSTARLENRQLPITPQSQALPPFPIPGDRHSGGSDIKGSGGLARYDGSGADAIHGTTKHPSTGQCPVVAVESSRIFSNTSTVPQTCLPAEASHSKLGRFQDRSGQVDGQQSDILHPSELADLEAHLPGGLDHNNAETSSTPSAKVNSSGVNGNPHPHQQPSVLPPQGLGRLESIFVRITKKIQQLELNQSMLTRQLEIQEQAWMAISQHQHELHTRQISEMQALLTEMRTRMDLQQVESDKTHRQDRLFIEELRRDNLDLWKEILIVREVITTMKAGILCALSLSACIIVFYLLRLLFRCVTNAKRRADLREWIWKMENGATSISTRATDGDDDGDNDAVGTWRVNPKKQFGSSWDDLAIERKTLLRALVNNSHTVDGRQAKRSRTSSLVLSPALKELIAQFDAHPRTSRS